MELDEAVKRVYQIKKENKGWGFSMVVSKVSEWHKIDYELLMGEIIRKNKMRIGTKRKTKVLYPKIPYWMKD